MMPDKTNILHKRKETETIRVPVYSVGLIDLSLLNSCAELCSSDYEEKRDVPAFKRVLNNGEKIYDVLISSLASARVPTKPTVRGCKVSAFDKSRQQFQYTGLDPLTSHRKIMSIRFKVLRIYGYNQSLFITVVKEVKQLSSCFFGNIIALSLNV